MANTEVLDDGRVKARVANYTAFWDKDSAQDGDAHKENRLDNYKDVINGQFFSIHLTHTPCSSSHEQDTMMVLLSYMSMVGPRASIFRGSTRERHFCNLYVRALSNSTPFLTPFFQLARHEHYLASMMNLKPGMRVLDVGCGVGGPAREISRFSDTHITGLNNNDFQIGRARKYTEKAGLSNQVQFVKGDFMKLSEQFGENSFDAGEFLFQSSSVVGAHWGRSVCH